MRHAEAQPHLSDLAAGTVDAQVRVALLAHVETCEECGEWLATYRLISAALGGGSASAPEHPVSDLLVRYTLSPQELDETVRAEIFQHVGSCDECRREMELTRAAVQQARPAGEEFVAPQAVVRPRRPRLSRIALAAAVAVALVGTGLVLRSRTALPVAGERPSRDLVGTQVIESEENLFAELMTLRSGSDVTLRAQGSVVLGDGFVVTEGAVLAIEVGAATQESVVATDSDAIGRS